MGLAGREAAPYPEWQPVARKQGLMNSNVGEPILQAHRRRAPRLALIALVASLCLPAAPAAAAPSTGDTPEGPTGTSPPAAPSPGPSISGTQRDGQTLNGSDGSWPLLTGTEHIWLRCSASGTGCAQVSSASSYGLTAADVNRVIKFRVRGTSLAGGYREADAVSGIIDAIVPNLTNPPTLSGTTGQGSALTGTPGSGVSGTQPISSSYRWLRCDAGGANCNGVTPAAGAPTSYALSPADVGRRIRFRHTLSGPRHVVHKDSAASAVVVGPPSSVGAPVIAGTVRQGQVLTGSQGFWSGTGPITFAYGWFRCGATCVRVGSGQSYRLTGSDVGRSMLFSVVATNSYGSGTRVVTTGPVSGSGSGSSPTPGGTSGGLRPLSPFPIVAIGGRVFSSGVVLSELRIRRAPRGSRVTITCRGRGCPFRRARYRMRRSSLRIRRLQRRLRGGAVITIFIRKGNTLGKYTRIRIRRGQAPARLDRCLRPGSNRPTRCP